MVNTDKLIARDLRHIWHPCSRMQDFKSYPPIIVNKAKGSLIYTNHGQILDGISSWWCKSLGHHHPAVISAIKKQLSQFEHVIGANTTHPAIVSLGEKLAKISGKAHVYFASDGSSAVEIALKLALHASQIKGQARQEFIALKNGYHGETLGTMSVSDVECHSKPYSGLGVKTHFIDPGPYGSCPLNSDIAEINQHWQTILPYLEMIKQQCCALIVEPLIQGAAGMYCYSRYFLEKICLWAKSNDLYIIFDEIMTGIGRTGTWLAADHLNITADIICLSKGLTSGTLPLSCVLIDTSIFQLFYDNKTHPPFLHSHTYSGHALAVSAALATLQSIEQEHVLQHTRIISQKMLQFFHDIAATTGKITNIRALGCMVAGELENDHKPHLGQRFAQYALKHGALLRPINQTLYWLPPLNTSCEHITHLAEITLNSIYDLYRT